MSYAFGEWLKAERERRGYNQKMLATKAGISPTTVSKLEKGAMVASRDMIERICLAMEASVEHGLALGGFAVPQAAQETMTLPSGATVSLLGTIGPPLTEESRRHLAAIIDAYLSAREPGK